MKSKYFREYFCSFSSKLYYFYILGVSHLKWDMGELFLEQWQLSMVTLATSQKEAAGISSQACCGVVRPAGLIRPREVRATQGPLLLTWFNFKINPTMDE